DGPFLANRDPHRGPVLRVRSPPDPEHPHALPGLLQEPHLRVGRGRRLGQLQGQRRDGEPRIGRAREPREVRRVVPRQGVERRLPPRGRDGGGGQGRRDLPGAARRIPTLGRLQRQARLRKGGVVPPPSPQRNGDGDPAPPPVRGRPVDRLARQGGRLYRLGDEAVAHPRLRDNVARARRVGFYFLAERADVDTHRVG